MTDAWSVWLPTVTDEDREARASELFRPRMTSVGFFGALTLHGLLLALVVLAAGHAMAPAVPPADPQGLQAEVISARDFDTLRGMTPPPEPEMPPPAAGEPLPSIPPLPRTAAAPRARAATQPEMIRPTRLLSEQALDSPRSRGLRRSLATLADEERIAQLCDLEAMEQVAAWNPAYRPDRLVDYALSDTRMEGDTLVAHGGAFRSRRQWYEISFRCELDAGQRKVAGFAFHVGEAIPREEWASDNLAAVR